VIYAGNLGTVQALDVVLDAAKLVNRGGVRVELVLVGTGVEETRLRERVATERLAGVQLVGRIPPAAMPVVYQEADALLVHLRELPLSRVAIPQKTQMCLAAGRPVLMGVAGEASALVRRARAGLVFEPESATALAHEIEKLIAMGKDERRAMGDHARDFYQRELSFARGVRAMIAVYESMGGGGRA
jgi:glycosyltransferase involved in cell wall biosynthesis